MMLKQKFRNKHEKVVNNLEPAKSIDFLFQERVISERNMRDLRKIKDDPEEQCRELLELLYGSDHPQGFIKLYLAMKKESNLHWLVDEIDRCSTGIVIKYTFHRMITTCYTIRSCCEASV